MSKGVLTEYKTSEVIKKLNKPVLTHKDMPYKAALIFDAAVEKYNGFRKAVVLPCGNILEDNGEVKIYYGASDIFECMAAADVNDLIKLC